jgi:hypothetical protein
LAVAGSWPTCPLKYRKPPTSIAWENGPTGGREFLRRNCNLAHRKLLWILGYY